MDDGELKKATDRSSSSDGAETNNGGFPQWLRDEFPYLPDAPKNGEKSAQSRQKSLYSKDSNCSTAVRGGRKQTKPKNRHPDIKKFFNLISVSKRGESDALSPSTDYESDVEKNVAYRNRKYCIKFNETSPHSLQQAYERAMSDECTSLNRKPQKHEKGNEIFLPEERLEPNMSNKEFNKSRSLLPTYRLGDHVVPSTSSSNSRVVPSTSSSNSRVVPSTSSSDIHAVPSTSSSESDAFKEEYNLTGKFGDLNLQIYGENSSLEENESDISDFESPTKKTHYTHKKRKLLKKSHRDCKRNTELKKRRVETPISLPPLPLPLKKFSSEEDLAAHAKQELKFSSSSEDDKWNEENKKRPISEEERSSPQTQHSASYFKISKRFKIEENCVSEEERNGLFTKSI